MVSAAILLASRIIGSVFEHLVTNSAPIHATPWSDKSRFGLRGTLVCIIPVSDDVLFLYCVTYRRETKAQRETENMGVCTNVTTKRKGVTAEVLVEYSWPLPALIHWEVKVGGTSMKDVGGAGFAGSSPPFLGRERMMMFITIFAGERETLVGD